MSGLDFNSREQLYYQVYDRLFQKIINKQYSIGECIPSESELMEIYKVSRSTARKAMEMLANDGFVKKKRGLGTIVISTHSKHSPQRVVNYFRKSSSDKAEKKVIDFETISPTEVVSELLNINKETDVIRLRRVRYNDLEPLYLEINYFEKNYVSEILSRDFSKESLRVYLDKTYNIKWSYAKQEIYSIAANKEVSKLLNVREGHPILRIKRVSFDIDDMPREYVDTYYLGNKYNLELELRI